jgi:hypothetical protein
MTAAHVRGIGLLGPGLPGWAASRAILFGKTPWEAAPVTLPAPVILPPTERRRTGPVARLALAVAHEAAEASGLDPATLRPVFGSGNGDSLTVGAILETLAQPDGAVSPTQFHNSVHNAAAGYWSIGTGSRRPATCLGCHDATFGAALLAAVAECAAEGEPVLLCIYDTPMPAPLDGKRHTLGSFGAAVVLAPEPPGPRLSVGWSATPGVSLPGDPALHPQFHGNPAARILPLLELLAGGRSGVIRTALLDGSVRVEVAP